MELDRFIKYALAAASILALKYEADLAYLLALLLVAYTVSDAANKVVKAMASNPVRHSPLGPVRQSKTSAKEPMAHRDGDTVTGDQLATAGGGGG
jgi:hypothetical protein